ncbi:MBL fold metallo-hydrolase [Ahrensia sp. R2A130]|uniref:MBL fold metallo-hydrolase n=1 Tax=Ahrensia sp. R2A130 TaxID=744979 RepID=UPI0001E0BC6F|nr:MBL fold metallo-hydrolase [Ahrensia sp. R2A130]EFL89441.1 conserved hypothetical protein [Ahrensia sp. R2A130]
MSFNRPSIVCHQQLPVGQGGFAIMSLTTPNEEEFHFIYDCGSDPVRNTERLIPDVKAWCGGHVDALFISHFDADHVDGLDRLLENIKIETVFIPYLSPVQQALVFIGGDGTSSGSLREIAVNPATWFGRRGVDRIVRVRGAEDGSEDEPPREPPTLDPDAFADGSKLGPSDVDRRYKLMTSIPLERATADLSDAEPDDAEQSILGFGGSVLISDGQQPLDWTLLPFVPDRTKTADFPNFENAFKTIVGAHSPKRSGSSRDSRLKAALQCRTCRSKMKAAYANIGRGLGGARHNGVSMSLYSGPVTFSAGTWTVSGWQGTSRRLRDLGDHPGWIAAGDAPLSTTKSMREWTSFFGHRLKACSVLVLPHHGAASSFNKDLLTPPSISAYVAAAGRPSQYRHPSASVCKAVRNASRRLIHVTQYDRSVWTMMAVSR